MFVVNAGAQVLFKAFNITTAGAQGDFAAVHVLAGGNAEFDNMALSGGAGGPQIKVDGGGTVKVVDSFLGENAGDNLESQGTSNVTLINVTSEGSTQGGYTGSNITAINTINVNNDTLGGPQTDCTSPYKVAIDDLVDDTSCGAASTGGITQTTNAAINFQGAGFYGGPIFTNQIVSPSSAINAGNPTWCPSVDGRFYPDTSLSKSPAKCDVGNYQSDEGANDLKASTDTAGPTCQVASVNQSSNPQTETVNATDSGVGLGADAITFLAPTGSTDPSPTDNGTVTYPVVGSSWFAMTSPTGQTGETDFPSTSPLAVTATKPTGDAALNDTHWSFDATDWLGNTNYCH
jgi:hypothetical protein